MKSGDHVKIVTRDDSYEGILMPDEEGFYVVKLENGYNIGVDKKRVKNLVLLGEGLTSMLVTATGAPCPPEVGTFTAVHAFALWLVPNGSPSTQ